MELARSLMPLAWPVPMSKHAGVGFIGYWLIVKGGTKECLREVGLNPAGEGGAPGWMFGGVSGIGVQVADNFPELVARASQEGGAAVGAYVFESDFGWVVSATDGEAGAELIFGEEAARRYGFVAPSDPEGFARWTEVAPVRLSPHEVREVLEQEWVFAEEGVAELLERTGLPAPYEPTEPPQIQANVLLALGERPELTSATVDNVGASGLGGYEAPFGWMSTQFFIGGDRVAWRDTRFVPGIGSDFLGIWDREQPDAPIRRFPRTPRSEGRVREELRDLERPLLLRTLDLDRLGGFRGLPPYESGGTYGVAQRGIPIREARFVHGIGDGFAAVWDRDRPGEPIARFPDTNEGQDEAASLAHQLLFEHAFAQRLIPGERLCVPWAEPRFVPLSGPSEGTRKALEEKLGGSLGPAYSKTWPGPWLLLEEEDGERWLPSALTATQGRWFLYVFTSAEPDGVFDLICEGCFATREDAQANAARAHSTEGPWSLGFRTIQTWLASLEQLGVAHDAAEKARAAAATEYKEKWNTGWHPETGEPPMTGSVSVPAACGSHHPCRRR